MDTIHPEGEKRLLPCEGEKTPLCVDTYGGRIYVEWDEQGKVTALGQLPFFVDFLKTGDLFEPWVKDCPLTYASPNAPTKTDVLGTLFLSVLSGHTRYAHINAIRFDAVNPELLGMRKVVSEDSVRRAFQGMEESAGQEWLQTHLRRGYEALLYEPWILDMDGTVKTVYGKQEGAEVGYNPHKPGRPSHVYQTYIIANLRLVIDVEVQPGNQTAASYAQPRLWSFLDSLPKAAWPAFVRGDCAWGNETAMREAEERGLAYLFKLKQSPNVKRLVEEVFMRADWAPAGQGWEGVNAELQLMGWTKSRRVAVLRREIPPETVERKLKKKKAKTQQSELAFMETAAPLQQYEYAVLATDLNDELMTIAQHYRDRSDAENMFDELKNQWGWSGYTTQDLKRCQIMARVIALIYNWWSLFARLAIPEKHAEAATSRPLLLTGVAKQIRHGGQSTLIVTNAHSKTAWIQKRLQSLAAFLLELKRNAEQLDWLDRWRLILSRALQKFLQGKILARPKWLPQMD